MLMPISEAALEAHVVGDCVAPRDIEHAPYEGDRIARLV
jgi:hypothetical protein